MTVNYDYILPLRGTDEERAKRRKEYHILINKMTEKYNKNLENTYNNSPLKDILTINEFEILELMCNYQNSL